MNRVLKILAIFIILGAFCLPVYSAIQTDGVTRDPSGGGGADTEETLTNKTIDGNNNILLILRHATDCTTFTTAIGGQYCWEQDADLLYVCEPTAGTCDTAGEWDAVATGGGGSVTVKESDNVPTVTSVTTFNFNASHFAVTDAGAGVADLASVLSPLATALAANGANCSAGNAPLGIDASGAAEGCFDVIVPGEIDTLAELNTVANATLKNFGVTTDGKACIWNNTATQVVCDSTFLTSANIDTLAELDGIVADKTIVDTDSTQTLTGKTLDGNNNTLQELRHATDCTAQTGKSGQFCFEQDSDNLYICEPSAGDCDTAGEWKLVNVGNAATATAATALAANGADCSGSIAAIGVDASGNAEGCFDVIIPSEIDSLTKLNNLITGTLRNYNTLTDENLCSYEATGTQVDCDTPTSTFEPAGVTCTNCVDLTTTTVGNYVANVATTSPLSGGSAGSEGASLTLTIADAVADGSTKGAASFTAADFNTTSGNVAIDYTNGQAASGSNKGFLASADWTTFNNKLSTGTAVSNIDLGGQKVFCDLRPQGNEPPAASFATMFQRNSHPGLSFDGNVCAIWTCVLSSLYQGNGVTVEFYTVSSGTANDLDWDGSWERIEATQDIDSDGFATAISADNNNNSGTSGVATKVSMAFTNGAQMDSCAAGELCRFRLCRDDTADTTAATNGLAVFIGGQIKETP